MAPSSQWDTAEDVVSGLRDAATLDWSCAGEGTTRILLHIADAPAHGERYNGGCWDRFSVKDPPGGAAARDPLPHLKQLMMQKVHYYFCKINGSTDTMIRMFNADLGKAYVHQIEMGSADKLVGTVMKTFSTSIMKTVAAAGGVQRCLPAEELEAIEEEEDERETGDAPPEPTNVDDCEHASVDWDALPIQKCAFSCLSPMSSLSALKNPFFPRARIPGCITVKIAPTPFARGCVRWAFHSRAFVENGEVHDFVFKRLLETGSHRGPDYFTQNEEYEVARFLSEQYNAQKPSHCRRVTYKPVAYTVCASDRTAPGKFHFYAAEPYLDGACEVAFEKYCDNVGNWDKTIYDETLLRFAKYTFDATGGYLMVSDLQGRAFGDEFQLTDPALLCKDVWRFGNTNLGYEAMKANYTRVREYLADFPHSGAP